MAFAGLGQFLAQWPRCPHFKQTSLSVFPLPLPFLSPFPLESFTLLLLLLVVVDHPWNIRVLLGPFRVSC